MPKRYALRSHRHERPSPSPQRAEVRHPADDGTEARNPIRISGRPSRPAWRYVGFSWPSLIRCRMVACRSWTRETFTLLDDGVCHLTDQLPAGGRPALRARTDAICCCDLGDSTR